jgi:gamma-glutamyl-gamma-aminobutyrate hydrolase PuuD
MMKIAIPVTKSKTQYFLNQAYIDYLVEAGFHPVTVYPGHNVAAVVKDCDGLLLPGGIDIDPIYYGYDNDSSYSVDPEKDEFERSFLKAFVAAQKPVMGICRGFQLIVREYIYQHDEMTEKGLMEFVEHINTHAQTTDQSLVRTIPVHWVRYVEKGLYQTGKAAVGDLPVNSMHHQCLVVNFGAQKVDNVERRVISYGDFHMLAWTDRGLKEDKKAPHRVICEACSISGWGAPILGVQWHPEELRDIDLLRNFFNRNTKKRRGPAAKTAKA